MDDQVDEDVLNVLLAEGIDAPTAYAASVPDNDQPRAPQRPQWFGFALLLGVLAVLVWQLF